MEKVYFRGRVVDRDIVIMTNDIGVGGKNKSLLVINYMRYESIGYHQLKTYSLESVSRHYIKEVIGYRGLNNQEFEKEFTKVLDKAIDEFKKDTEREGSFDFFVGKYLIQPIERLFDWIKK
jgi:hypothetical protein